MIVALGGLLFGFDTAVISGAEQAIEIQRHLSEFMVGQMVAMGLYGTTIGALLGGIPAERWGRKSTLFWFGVPYLAYLLGYAFSPSVSLLMFFRFLYVSGNAGHKLYSGRQNLVMGGSIIARKSMHRPLTYAQADRPEQRTWPQRRQQFWPHECLIKRKLRDSASRNDECRTAYLWEDALGPGCRHCNSMS